MERVCFLTDPLMQRFKETAEKTFMSSFMTVSTCTTFNWQVVCVIEDVVENLLPFYRL